MPEQNQPINTLPIKTASGITATDYILGIGSAEEYQMLIQDLGDYIIQHATSLLAGQSRTVADAISVLNSKLTFTRINSGTINNASAYPQGVYVQYVAGTVTGAPLDSAGVVITFSWADWYVVQLACVSSAMVWRRYSSSAWSNWTTM